MEHSDAKYAPAGRPRSITSDGTTRVPGEDENRQIYKMLEAAIARVSILEERRDIYYENAFKATGRADCLVRGCGAKSSSFKNEVRHFKNTRTPEHDIAAILLQQKECFQCEESWKSSAGLDYHERTVHQETRLSRIETFLPYLKQPLRKCFPRYNKQALAYIRQPVYLVINQPIHHRQHRTVYSPICRSSINLAGLIPTTSSRWQDSNLRIFQCSICSLKREPPNPGVR